jgi:heat-inducible transcriptional repressor
VVEKRTLALDAEADEARISAATGHLASHLIGRTVTGIRSVTLSASGDPVTDELSALAVSAFRATPSDDSDHVFVGGAARTAAAFDAVHTVREVLGILEHQLVVVGLLRDVLDRGLSVAIGAETGLLPLSECSVVVAPYEVEGERAGTIGVLGPTRMNYPQAMAAVAAVSQRLSRRLSEG